MSKITDDGFVLNPAGLIQDVPYGNSGRQRVKTDSLQTCSCSSRKATVQG